MAEVVRAGDELVVRLTAVEKALAFHRDLRVPASAVASVGVLDHPLRHIKGATRNMKIVGGYWPGRFACGTFRDESVRRRLFAAVLRRGSRGLEIVLEGARYTRLIVAVEDPEATKAALSRPDRRD